MKQPGTTAKHAGTTKHHAGASKKPGKHDASGSASPKHHPHHESAHEKKLRHHDAVVKRHEHKTTEHKSRKLALPGAVACCSAEALAASLRLAGHPVSGSDVYALYRATARGDDDGATILATLKAASTFGLAGVRLVGLRAVPVSSPHVVVGGELPGSHALYFERGRAWSWGAPLDLSRFPDWEPEEAWELRWAL